MGKKIDILPSLNWDIQEQPVFSPSIIGGDLVQLERYKNIVRNDNNASICVMKQSYTPMKNSEFTDAVNKISEISGLKIEGFSDFKGSTKVIAYLKNTKEDLNIGGHKIEDYMILGNSHDGSSSFFLGTVSELLRCTNQFGRVRLTKAESVRHTKRFEEKMVEFYKYVESYFIDRKVMYNNFNRFGDKIVTEKIRKELITLLFNLEEGKEISTRKQHQIAQANNSISNEMKCLGDNFWGLFNGITHFTTHVIESREEVFGNAFGKKAELNNKAYQFCLEKVGIEKLI
jgi:hypothetical protein